MRQVLLLPDARSLVSVDDLLLAVVMFCGPRPCRLGVPVRCVLTACVVVVVCAALVVASAWSTRVAASDRSAPGASSALSVLGVFSARSALVAASARSVSGAASDRSALVAASARFVVKGFLQRKGVDYNQVFSPVMRGEQWRLMVAVATALAGDLGQMW